MSKKKCKCEDSSSTESESEYENKKILKYYIKKHKNREKDEPGDSKCKKYKLILLEKSVKCGIKCVKLFDII